MQATLQPPVRFGREHVDALSNVISDFQKERARLEGFSRELADEWQLLHDELSGSSVNLEQIEESLNQRERDLSEQIKSAADQTARAKELECQLRAAQGERDDYRQQIEHGQQERIAVRQQLHDVNSGVLSLAELIRVVHSTYSEIDKVQEALGQQALELISSIDGGPSAPVRDHQERYDPPRTVPAASADHRRTDNHADELDAADASEPLSSADRLPEEEFKPEPTVSDPVIGSVLAELTRLGKK